MENSQQNTPAAQDVKKYITPSVRFTNAVMKNFSSENGEVQVTNQQKRLCQSYFVKIDQALKAAELKRISKAEKYREPLAYIWENVNMNKLAVDVVAYSSVGLDPMQKNHLHLIPYKYNAADKYDIQFTKGYNGIELVAKKYGVDVPDDVVVRVVYSNEKFIPAYKDTDNKKECFTHKPSENPFEKGEIVGGYYYHAYFDHPEKNKLRVFSLKDIEKRIPKSASVEFWGGEKDLWKNGTKEGKEKVEGWRDEMVWKTIKRAAWDAINIDSQKIDDYIQKILAEQEGDQSYDVHDDVKAEITSNANKTVITMDIEAEDVTPTQANQPVAEQEKPKEQPSMQSKPQSKEEEKKATNKDPF